MRLANFVISQKLALLSFLCLIAAAVPATMLVRELGRQAEHASKAAAGARSVRTVLECIRLVQQHRGLSNGVLSGNAALVAPRNAKKAEVMAALQAMRDAAAKEHASLVQASAGIAREFGELAAAVDGSRIAVRESFQRHTDLIARTLKHLENWLDSSGLSFDADPVGHFLVAATYRFAPALTEAVGQARATGTALLTRQAASSEERLFVGNLLARAADQLGALRGALGKAGEADAVLLARLRDPLAQVEAETRRVVEVARRELVEAKDLAFGAVEYFGLTTRTIDAQFKLIDALAAELVTTLEQRERQRARTRNAMLAAALLLLFGIAALSWAITRAITRPLSLAVSLAGRIAAGHLDNAIHPEGRDETARLLLALQEMQRQLVEVVSRIQDASHSIRDASTQTAEGNADLSSRTEGQAASLEQTAASMEEITTTVRQNADSANAAMAMARATVERARSGGELVERVVGAMTSISESARRVRDITATIDGIAFQTNLLALNAAVEAARAAAHGRGFAVVAAEVRTLAQRCAHAAQEIRGLIKSSVDQIEAGRATADLAGSAMAEVVGSVEQVAQRLGEITSASAEQRAGIEQVNQAVAGMEMATQQNAALVEEAAAAALALEQQAAELSQLVAGFSTGRAPAAPQVAQVRDLRPMKLKLAGRN